MRNPGLPRACATGGHRSGTAGPTEPYDVVGGTSQLLGSLRMGALGMEDTVEDWRRCGSVLTSGAGILRPRSTADSEGRRRDLAGSGEHIKALVKSHASGDDASFYAVAGQIAAQA